ncbi:hypothetical protein [Aquimarina intermedia]|uniref:Uncharacterized protein n=1 Tax=Aquimarina intermedia TaxID=350814 RepID=A0A5S5C7I4_9FLAO|nr:hypothetical protein [Aquimarina intermedia]TYP74290.1 hypothetical protein BD809_104108 [Aquimarina intermedia]
MKIEHLEERVNDYKESIRTVVEKKTVWKQTTKKLIHSILTTIENQYPIGWEVQELSWIGNNEAVNINFYAFPPELIDCTNQIPAYQFIGGSALVFSQMHNGDVYIFIMFPLVESSSQESNIQELGVFKPTDISEKLIVEKVDEFLKEMIQWEVPSLKNRIGF